MINKRRTNKRILSLIFISLLLIVCIISFFEIGITAREIENDNLVDISYTTREPIIIDSDDDFGPTGYNFPGAGLVSDPYIIDDFKIASQYETAIDISDTTVYFVIQNCLLEDSMLGIGVHSIAYGTAKIISNVIRNNKLGIYATNTEGAIFDENEFTNNEYSGLTFYRCADSIIANNTFTGSGIVFDADPWNPNLSECLSYNVYNNQLDGKPIGWFDSLTSVSYTTSYYGQLFLIDCDDILIQNQYASKYTPGVELLFCTNAKLEDNECKIHIYGSSFINVTDNIFSGNFLLIGDSSEILAEGNDYSGDSFELYCYNSFHLKIRNNKLGNNANNGLYLDECSHCLVESNVIRNCYESGIYMVFSDNILIKRNKIEKANVNGIRLGDSSNNEIAQNIIMDSLDYGINIIEWMDGATMNSIYQNIFINNNIAGCQANDDSYLLLGTDNYWYNTSTELGNWWDDLSGSEYSIDGTASYVDLFPLEDTDSDGMSPDWEVKYNLDVWSDDSTEDPDDDDLTNIEEYNLKTNPIDDDTDSDGLKDGEEVNEYETDPKDEDSDNDRLKDGEEVLVYFTNPNDNDTDDDGISDFQEVETDTDPLDPNDPPPTTETRFEFFIFLVAIVIIPIISKKKKK